MKAMGNGRASRRENSLCKDSGAGRRGLSNKKRGERCEFGREWWKKSLEKYTKAYSPWKEIGFSLRYNQKPSGHKCTDLVDI